MIRAEPSGGPKGNMKHSIHRNRLHMSDVTLGARSAPPPLPSGGCQIVLCPGYAPKSHASGSGAGQVMSASSL
jgi:hypothetical protein